MTLDSEKAMEELRQAAKPLVNYLNKKLPEGVSILVQGTYLEIIESTGPITCEDLIED